MYLKQLLTFMDFIYISYPIYKSLIFMIYSSNEWDINHGRGEFIEIGSEQTTFEI